jgi:hypothetical protein
VTGRTEKPARDPSDGESYSGWGRRGGGERHSGDRDGEEGGGGAEGV